jgi:trk system potassium uptake protein TrkA
MKICIVGGGKIGYYLAKTLMEHKHEPIVIEEDPVQCRRLADSLDLTVMCGSGTSPDVLESANLGQCGALVAVTGEDEDNLVACQLAKQVFHVKRTVARVNNPKNAAILRKLGVDIAVSSTEYLTHLIEREVETSAIRPILSLSGGEATLFEIAIPENFLYGGRPLSQMHIPNDNVVVSITRGEEMIVPRGSTVILPNDRVVVLAKNNALHTLAVAWKLREETL